MIFGQPATPLALILLCFVGIAVRPIGVFCLVLAAVTGALSLWAYILYRRVERTPQAKAFKAWEAHCRTKRRADLGKPDPVRDQLWADYLATRAERPEVGKP